MLSSPICKKEKHEIPLKCRGVERDNVVFDGGCVAPGENWRKLIAVSGRLSGAWEKNISECECANVRPS